MSMRLSPSLAKVLLQKSPKHAYLAATERSNERSDAQRFGALVDRLVFGVGDKVVIKEKRGQEEEPGTILVTEADHVKAIRVATAVTNFCPDLRKSMIQPYLRWHTEGIECSGRPDHIDEDQWLVNDLKTAHDLSDDAIVRSIELYGYDIQAAAYLEAVTVLYEWPRPRFRFIFVETAPPYDVRIVEPDQLMISSGQALWRKAVMTWKHCLETNTWPGRGNMVATSSRYRRAKDNDSDSFMNND
jgi:hypothetical protein